jgi:hypothetical protein
MKKSNLLVLLLPFIMLLPGFRPAIKQDDKPGFTIHVNGDQFKDETFFIPPLNATYCNLYFDFKADPRAKRTVLTGYAPGTSLQLNIHVPIHKTTGSYTFVQDNIPTYMWFDFTYEKDGVRTPYLPGKITVNITHYGNVGEFIEGNFSGELQGGNGKITAEGSFKVKRIKDKT